MGEIRENLRLNLISLLELNKMSQKDFSKKLGVSQSAVTNWIKGKNSPDIELVEKICQEFNVSPNYLFNKQPYPISDEEEIIICDKTGLNNETIRYLAKLLDRAKENKYSDADAILKFLNDFIINDACFIIANRYQNIQHLIKTRNTKKTIDIDNQNIFQDRPVYLLDTYLASSKQVLEEFLRCGEEDIIDGQISLFDDDKKESQEDDSE